MLAGAGSGKTRVIVHKIARLLEAGYAPSQIAAITFTNKAAAEMRERAGPGRRPAAAPLAISTFHSLGVRMLRSDGERLGLKKNFSILDSDDVLGVLKDAGGTTDIALARRWQWAIGGWKNRGLDAAGAEAELSGEPARDAADALVAVRVMQRYEERLTAYQAVDFDDLSSAGATARPRCRSARGLARPAALRAGRRVPGHQRRPVRADEAARRRAGLFTAVGDDDQSIYGWRGATVENLKRLPPTIRR